MNQVDFLPESYRRTQQRRGRQLRHIMLVLAVASGLVFAAAATKSQTRKAKLNAERLEGTVESEQVTLGALADLEREHKGLMNRSRLRRELEPTVMYSQVIASITEVLPAEVALSELTMQTVKPAPEPKETDAQREARQRRSAKNKDKKPIYEPHLIGVEITGLASDDLAVAHLVSSLDAHPLFSRVTMRSSRTIQTQGVHAREFSLTATVDLDRELKWANPDALVEVTLAD